MTGACRHCGEIDCGGECRSELERFKDTAAREKRNLERKLEWARKRNKRLSVVVEMLTDRLMDTIPADGGPIGLEEDA